MKRPCFSGPFLCAPCMAANLVVRVHCGGCNRQPPANSKGVHCEVESAPRDGCAKGSWRQNSALMNTNFIRHTRWDETAQQVEVQRLHGHRGVNEGVHGVKAGCLTTGGLMDVRKRRLKHGGMLVMGSPAGAIVSASWRRRAELYRVRSE